MTDINFLVVSKYHKVLPGGYWFILLGPILDGLLGGEKAWTNVPTPVSFTLLNVRYDGGDSSNTCVHRRLH